MERRKFLIGAGSAAIGSSALVGSGAFTSASAERDVSINVAGDANAFLGIESTEFNDEYVTENEDGTVALDFTSSSGAGGDGLNNEAYTKFNKILKFTNNGTDTIALYLDNGHSANPSGFPYGADPDLIEKLSNEGNGKEDSYDASILWNFPRSEQPEAYNPGGSGYAFGLDDSGFLAPQNVDTTIFDNPGDHPYVLEPGDSLLQNIQINTKSDTGADWSVLDNVTGTVALVGYTKDFAENDV